MNTKLAEHVLVNIRKPWVLIDEILTCDSNCVRCSKLISSSDSYLIGHFPDASTYPGVLLLEGIRQATQVLLASRGISVISSQAVDARFLVPVLPGQTVIYTVELTAVNGGDEFRASGKGEVDGREVVRAHLGLIVAPHVV